MNGVNHPTKPVLLDTHIWFWLAGGVQKSVSGKLLERLEPLIPKSEIRVSIISVWEIGLLASKQKIEFVCPIDEWIQKALRLPGIRLIELTPEIALDSNRLPGLFHGDPADRILMATARKINATLITRDKEILSYCHTHHFSAISL